MLLVEHTELIAEEGLEVASDWSIELAKGAVF